MAIKITSPAKGLNTITTFGPYKVEFRDGVAEIPDINEGLRAWLLAHGYKVEGKPTEPATPAKEEAKAPAEDAPFVASEHNEKEILEHASGLDPEALALLVQEEEGGKARKGVLEGLAKLQTPPAEDLIGETE